MRTTTRRLLATLAIALAAAAAAPLLPTAAPAGAAPPAAAHAGLVSTNPVDTTPHVLDGRTEAVLDLGSRVIVGGTFTQVKRYSQPATFARSYLFAYDKATGTIDTTFLPQPNGRVSALLLGSDGKVLVSGQFTSIGGRSVPYLAKLDPATGAADAGFAPSPDGMVYDLHQANGLLYLAGTFSAVGGAARTNFAVVDPASGAVRGSNLAFAAAPRGNTRVLRFDISPDGKRLVAIGSFAQVGGQPRPNVAMLDLAAGGGASVRNWSTTQYRDGVCGSFWDTITYDVDIAPDGRYFVIVTTGGPGGTSRLCDSATRWELGATGTAQPTWRNYTGGDSLTSVAVTGAAVYVAGHQRWLDNPQGRDSKGPGGVDRQGIGALDPATGKALSWNPGRERGLVAPRLVPTAQGLYVLSDSSQFAGEWHPRLTYLPLPGTAPPPPPPVPTTTPSAPGTPTVTRASGTGVGLAWAAPASAGSSALTGYRITVRVGPEETVAATLQKGTSGTGSVSGLTPGRLYRFSVAAQNGSGYGPESSLSAPALPPFPTLDAFTDRQVRDVTGRASSASERASWEESLAGGTATPGELVDQLLDATATVPSVTRLYSAYYQRLPDTSGLNYWVGRARGGTSLRTISQSFSQAPEFTRLYGRLGNAAFVDLVYRNVLGRAPDASGRAYWTNQLNRGASRGSVMIGFSESAEYQRATRATTEVVATYQALLRRVPQGSERTTWEPQIQGGTSRAQLVAAVLASPAYDARV